MKSRVFSALAVVFLGAAVPRLHGQMQANPFGGGNDGCEGGDEVSGSGRRLYDSPQWQG